MSAEQVSSGEDIIINDIFMKINPSNIGVNDQRFLSTSSFIRDEATYSFYSKFGTSGFNILLSFDMNSLSDLSNLTLLATELDRFPFVFIKSKRLSDYVHDSKNTDKVSKYEIFGVKNYSFDVDSDQNHVVFVNLSISYFNYLPFSPSFSFLAKGDGNKKRKTPGRGSSKTQKASFSVESLSESTVYEDFMKPEFRKRMGNIQSYIAPKSLGLDYMSMLMPVFIVGRSSFDIEIKKREESGREMVEDIDWRKVYSGAGMSELRTNGKTEEIKDTEENEVYVIWDTEISRSGIDDMSNINNSRIRVKRFSIRKSNNFVSHNMTGWTYPVLQYMGKGVCDVELVLESDSHIYDSTSSVDSRLSPIFLMKHKLKTLDVNFVNFKKYSAFNLLKIKSIISDILPIHGLIVDSENILTNEQDQGVDTLVLTLRESKVESLFDNSQYVNAGTRDSDFAVEEMAATFAKMAIDLEKEYDIYSTVGIGAIFNFAAKVARNSVADEVLLILARLYNELEEILQDEDIKDSRYTERLYSMHVLSSASSFDKNDISKLDYLFKFVLSPKNLKVLDRGLKLRVELAMNVAMRELIRESSGGNATASMYVSSYAARMVKDYSNVVESFKEHGMPDLDLDDIRSNPFFMLSYDTYATGGDVYKLGTKLSSGLSSDKIRSGLGELTSSVNDVGDGNDRKIEYKKIVLPEEGATGKVNNGIMNTSESVDKITDVDVTSEVLRDKLTGANAIDIDPFEEDHQLTLQASRMMGSVESGMNMAFPVVKVFIVEGDETSVLKAVIGSFTGHNFYELKGIELVGIAGKTDENPVETMFMKIANPNSAFTNESVHFDTYKPKRDIKQLGTEDEVRFSLNQIRLKVGNRIHVRAGYSNNINSLETIFNGEITEMSGEAILSVQAESFARETIAYEYGNDPSEDNFFLGADTASIIANALGSDEIEHFGKFNIGNFGEKNIDKETRGLMSLSPTGIFKYSLDTNLFTNVYYRELLGIASDGPGDDTGLDLAGLIPFWDNQLFTHYPIYKATPWSMIKEMEYRHPGLIAEPLWYGVRQTCFFGIKEQLYVHRDLPSELMEEARSHMFSYASNPIYEELRWRRFKPAFDFHIALSETNIIKNHIKLSSNFNTVANVQYYGDEDDIGEGDFDYREIKIDDNLRPSAHRRGDVEFPGIHGGQLAWSYGSVYLKKEAERMYDGELLLLGNEKIKHGDFIYINDSFRGMEGVIKVRGVTHHFDLDNGFVTVVTPGLWIESSLYDRTNFLFEKLQVVSGIIAASIQSKAQVANSGSDAYVAGEQIIRAYSRGDISRDAAIGLSMVGYTAVLKYGIDSAIDLFGTIKNKLSESKKIPRSKSLVINHINSLGKDSQILKSASVKAGEFVKSKNLMSASRFIGMSRIASFTPSPLSLAILLGSLVGKGYWDKLSKGRQPVRIHPLSLNGQQFIAGIYGYEENTWWESIKTEYKKTYDSLEDIWRLLSK